MPHTMIPLSRAASTGADEPLKRYRALVRRVAHDLNNILVLPLTLGTLLAEDLPAGQNQTDAEAIVAATMRARDLVELLQTLTKSTEPEREAA